MVTQLAADANVDGPKRKHNYALSAHDHDDGNWHVIIEDVCGFGCPADGEVLEFLGSRYEVQRHLAEIGLTPTDGFDIGIS